MTKRFDYIIVSQQSWDIEIGSNAKNIAMEIAKQHRVLYINRPLDIQTRLKAKKEDQAFIKNRTAVKGKSVANQIKEVAQNLYVFTPACTLLSINGMPDGAIYDWANRYNNRLLANEIEKAIQYLNLKQYILINDGEIFNGFYLNEMLNAEKNLYYYRDYFLAVPYWQKHGKRLEPKLLSRYDGVVCNSEFLADVAKSSNKDARFVGQGCDYTFFELEDSSAALDIKNDKPVVGYVGALNSLRLDVPLLENLCASNPQWQWVFVGPEDETFQKSSLHELKNVTFTGSKSQEQLAAYINAFDVAINPQVVNDVTIGNYPRKIDEYLYMGKPTVATRTKAMEMFGDYCFLASGKESYEQAISAALNQNSPEKSEERRAFALTHSWENSVNKIYQAIAS